MELRLSILLLAAAPCMALRVVTGPHAQQRNQLGRRQALVGGLGLALTQAALPAFAAMPTKSPQPLVPELVQLLRVQEATTQEARLVGTGKYKDLQRANIKRAVQV